MWPTYRHHVWLFNFPFRIIVCILTKLKLGAIIVMYCVTVFNSALILKYTSHLPRLGHGVLISSLPPKSSPVPSRVSLLSYTSDPKGIPFIMTNI